LIRNHYIIQTTEPDNQVAERKEIKEERENIDDIQDFRGGKVLSGGRRESEEIVQ